MNVQQKVIEKIISQLETGVKPWKCPWVTTGESLPKNLSTMNRYQGINVLMLWVSQIENGFSRNYWLTFNQAKELGGFVRKGEKSTMCIKYGTHEKENDDGDKESYRYMKPFFLFNVDQIDGLESVIPPLHQQVWTPDQACDEMLKVITAYLDVEGIKVTHAGNEAFYRQIADTITLPLQAQFNSHASYAATLCHETIHSTGHFKRTNRFEAIKVKHEDKDDYAFEEIVTELATCILMAKFGVVGDPQDHVSYIGSWLKRMKEDPRFLFKACSYAEKAVGFLEEKALLSQEQISLVDQAA